jgi:ABC-type multidrug transport system ATPase subunit
MFEAASNPPDAPAALLRVTGLHLRWGDKVVFTDLSLQIGPGLTAVYGDESCGKSSLLRLLAGALEPQAGAFYLDGVHANTSALRQTCYWNEVVSDAHDASSARSYWTGLSARYPAWDAPALEALVQGLGLREHADKPLYMLSTGSKRKVWLAAAFASGARLVLMDTPFAALDQASVNCVRQWLERLARSPNRACVIADYQAPIALPLKQSLCLQHGALKTV